LTPFVNSTFRKTSLNRDVEIRSLRLILLLLVIWLPNTVSSQNKLFNQDSLTIVFRNFGNQIKEMVRENGKGSISAAILINNSVIWAHAYGYANQKNKIKSDSSFLYRVASITKPFTATLMMILVEEGILVLEDPVEKYLPEVQNLIDYHNYEPITIRQLAAHTSGLLGHAQISDVYKGPVRIWEQKLIEAIPKTGFQSKPNEKFNFSNIGYDLLGLTLSRAASKPYVELIQDKIITPLGLKNSFFAIPDSLNKKIALGYQKNIFGVSSRLSKRGLAGLGCSVPSGSLFSTPVDLLKFTSGILRTSENMIISEDAQKLILTNPGKEIGDYFGFFVFSDETNKDYVNHSGSL